MKKFGILTAIILLLSNNVFAETSRATTDPVMTEAVEIPDAEDLNTSPITALDPTTENESVQIDNHLKVIPKTDHDEDAEYHYTIDVTYPQISGDDLSQTAQQFNQIINKMVNDKINQFKNNVKFDSVHMNTLPEEMRKNTLKMDYDIDVIKPDAQLSLVSVRLSIEGMQAGRPHPLHSYQVLNYDITHGKELSLNDLFKKNTKYLTVISKYSSNKLNETLQDKWLIENGTKPDPQNYKNWNLENDSLLITFDEYQVAPYADGPQEIEIPLTELTKILASNAPVMAEFKQAGFNNATKKVAKTKAKNSEKIAVKEPASKAISTQTIG